MNIKTSLLIVLLLTLLIPSLALAQDTTPEPEQPIETEAPDVQPTAAAPETEAPPSSGGLTGGVIIGLIIAAGLVILILIGVMIGRSTAKQAPQAPPEDENPDQYQ